MENSNRPVQRVTPIRSEYPNRLDGNLNIQSSSAHSDFSLCNQTNSNNNINNNNLINNVNVQQFKINNNSNNINNNSVSNQPSTNIIDSLPFLQQNVNIMNINLPSSALLQNVSQESLSMIQNANFSPQSLSTNQKTTLIQLSDGRIVQIAQNHLPANAAAQQMQPTTILVQMPYKTTAFETATGTVAGLQQKTNNPNTINKKFLLPSKTVDKSNSVGLMKPISLVSGSNVPINVNGDLIIAASPQTTTTTTDHPDYQRNQINFEQKQMNHMNILQVDKYQEICDQLHNKKLLTKLNPNEETVLVEFRLNQQKYQLRMTRNQKVEMEKILISVGNQQKQMEILQVYQAEQRKMMQQRTSVVLNQVINKSTASNIVCNKPTTIQGLNIAKQVYPINSVLVAVPQSQYTDSGFVQSSNNLSQSKNISIQPSISQTPNGILVAARLPISQQSNILSPYPIARDSNKDTLSRPKRNFKTPNAATPITSLSKEFLPNANANNEMKPARSRRYNNMRKVLLDDHNTVLMPNYSKPFSNINDAVQRLLPYHIFEESKDQKTTEVDNILHNAFTELNKKCANLKRISSALSMNELLRDKNSENLLIKKMRLDLERDVFEREKQQYVNNSEEIIPLIPLQFDEEGNAFPISVESPVMPVITEEDLKVEDKVDTVYSDPVSSFVESLEENSNVHVETTSDSMQDFSYDIQDISIDSIDSPVSECDWSNPDKESGSVEVIENPQSEDPDLDAAIKSILF